ncbi:MAG: hypothetical protein JXR88_04950 [Clostridia bacterium]|nr:hypothetical protein [Clostridia bacterium]
MKFKWYHGTILLLILLLIFTYVVFENKIKEKENTIESLEMINQETQTELSSQINSLETKIIENEEQIKVLNNSLVATNEVLEGAEEQNHVLLEQLDQFQRNYMFIYDFISNRTGLDDPDLILEDLLQHSERIETPPVLGGTMYFYDAKFVSEFWVYGAFEDGHITGGGLYAFDVSEAGQITWTTLFEKVVE